MSRFDSRTEAIVGSALWAAAGDAIGWITELGDEDTIRYRTGQNRVRSTVEWRRRIGGRFGPTLQLPSGTYSDDTQLRLAVSRSTRGDGDFDVEAFAKVELPVWASYSLGAGRGTSAAASSLTKGTVSWFSNFFGSRGERGYLDAGGNGAAMRIQPHVWKSNLDVASSFVKDVLRDAITTHGHPKGFCGALFHAFCLAHAIALREMPGPDEWVDFANQLRCIPEAISSDEQLSLFWLGPWEEGYGMPLRTAIQEEIDFVVRVTRLLRAEVHSRERAYSTVLETVGGFDEQTRGAGLNTALAATALAYLTRDRNNEESLLLAANAPGSDTDTIATMAGAILGAARPTPVGWTIQDREYITDEAIRLSEIAQGHATASFRYPDLISWSPPTTQSDAVGLFENQICLAGLGRAEPFGEVFSTSEAKWQWLRLEFGQTVLAKQRPKLRQLTPKDLPNRTREASINYPQGDQVSLFQDDQSLAAARPEQRHSAPERAIRGGEQSFDDLNVLTDSIIERGFRPEDIGRALIELAQGKFAIERSTAFSAIIAKALEARRRRKRR
ncbi:ADP-ribosylglycohydrolase family protein [Bradyrhizobium sp. Pear77]|uniref:ADP-ribosylglycohydrolase family protein n=1 Tax=Bradyrhizobium altum TaxID=1571202 RepID=UPI001E5ECAB6|nr:ADP-ribosylglycohydrolase family protein [Bradyrhizobium altum]MCC8959937.1 ADP-ribosylglycohydrolase family protein [Bradyrhizobium altum]